MGTSKKKVDTWYFNLEDVVDKQVPATDVEPETTV